MVPWFSTPDRPGTLLLTEMVPTLVSVPSWPEFSTPSVPLTIWP